MKFWHHKDIAAFAMLNRTDMLLPCAREAHDQALMQCQGRWTVVIMRGRGWGVRDDLTDRTFPMTSRTAATQHCQTLRQMHALQAAMAAAKAGRAFA